MECLINKRETVYTYVDEEYSGMPNNHDSLINHFALLHSRCWNSILVIVLWALLAI